MALGDLTIDAVFDTFTAHFAAYLENLGEEAQQPLNLDYIRRELLEANARALVEALALIDLNRQLRDAPGRP